ncbi:MAG: branched-chain amino acid transaminase [Anaerolineales bacterium]|nr:branched-chain amino acid transaminase [Anaerolineales bacterium]
MSIRSDFIWMQGELIPFEEAQIHFLTPALHYGTGAFEGIRCYATNQGPAVFRHREHLQRLLNSVHILGITAFPYSLEELRKAVFLTIRANKFEQCYIRPLVYAGSGPLGLDLDQTEPRVGIAVWEWGTYLGREALERGVRMTISSFTRLHPNAQMTKAKISGNYANSVMAKTQATRLGFDEAIMLDPEGYVGECTGENLFVVRDGVIYTPPRASILEGVTRDALIALAGDLGYAVVEARISRDQLYVADEIFVSGTAAECVAVREVDFRSIGNGGMGPITRRLQQAFVDVVHGLNGRSDAWLDYVPAMETIELVGQVQ